MSERVSPELWIVAVGDPPFHFGPFASEEDAAVYVGEHSGLAWPLWLPEDERAHTQEVQTRGHYRSLT